MLGAIGGMYEDNLYLSNLYDFLEQQSGGAYGTATTGLDVQAGIELDDVTFTYPGATVPALRDVTLRVRPGQSVALVGSNGSGKTTLVKLLAGLYAPTEGTVRYQGRDLRDWDPVALRQRIGVIFQDFNRYQLTVGENIGAGDVAAFDDRGRWSEAASEGPGRRVHRAATGGLRDAARPLVQQRPRAVGRPMATHRVGARFHAHAAPRS